MSAWEPMLHTLATERYPRLLARAGMLTGSRAEAEDLVQDALVATFARPRGFASIGQAEQYVRCAIVTHYLDSVRKRRLERERWDRAPVAAASGDHAATVAGSVDAGAALRGLPPRVMACIALRYLEDLSIAETGRLLNLSEGAVKRYVSDGLAALNAQLGTMAALSDHERVGVHTHDGGVK